MLQSINEHIVDDFFILKPLLYKQVIKPRNLPDDITSGGFFALTFTYHRGTVTMSEIGKEMSIPKSNVTAIVDKLIAGNYVERINDETDRRIVKIRLTEHGINTITLNKQLSRDFLHKKLLSLTKYEVVEFAEAVETLKNIFLKINWDK